MAGIEAARDAFYKDEIAERILDFISTPVEDASGSAHAGLLSYDDFADWEAEFNEPVSVNYHAWTCTNAPVGRKGRFSCSS